MSSASSYDQSPVPAPEIHPSQPSGCPSDEIAPDLVAQLQARIKTASPLSLKILHRIAAGEQCRIFDAIKAECALIEVENLLDALEIIHCSFHDRNDLEGVRRVCAAMGPVIATTVAETAKLRATLFEGGTAR